MTRAAAADAPEEERRSLLVPDVPRWPRSAGPILELVDVHVSFAGRPVFSGLSLPILPGETTVVIGQSGSGKSVLLKTLLGMVVPDGGVVRLFGKDVQELSPVQLLELRKRCSMLFQGYALLDSMTVQDNIAFPLRQNTRLGEVEIARRVDELLELLELKGAGRKLPAELSGGMKKRVSLARALITQPEVVLFDEPTTGLDPVMIEFVDELIRRAQARFRITSVIISHDMASVLKLATRLAMLDEGRIIAYGRPEELRGRDEPRLRAFLEAGGSGRLARSAVRGSGDPPARRGASPAMPAAAAVSAPRGPAPQPGGPAVELIDVHRSFGEHQVLRGVELAIPRGLITMIIGGSGSGKSVIIKHIMGLLRADRGRVLVFGQDVTLLAGRALSALQARIGFLFQGAALFDSMTIAENVAFPLRERRKLPGREVERQVAEMLARLHIPGLADKFPGEVSAGERKRAGLARALITRPELLIYDEPTTGQDPLMIRSVDEMIHQTWEELGITSVVISHDMQSTFRIGHRVAMLHEGRIRACGTPEELLASADEVVRRFIYAGAEQA